MLATAILLHLQSLWIHLKLLIPLWNFLLGVMVGHFFPKLLKIINDNREFTAKKAEYIARNAIRVEREEIRSSKIFKERLSAILKTIREKSSKHENELRVTNVESCKTDQQIRKALEERGFSIIRAYENGMTIRW
jgi:hypothetical protein